MVIVTGSSRGIGREIAKEVVRLGGKAVINGRDKEALSDVADQLEALGGEFLVKQGDVSVEADMQELINDTIRHFGQIDILINNAGVAAQGWSWEWSAEYHRRIMEINYLGSIFPTRHALPHLEKTGGSVVMVSSLTAYRGFPLASGYCASKMAQAAFAQSMHTELFMNGSKVHIGVAYVGFTENDPGKTILRTDGKRRLLKKRQGHTQQAVARKILAGARNRKRNIYVSFSDRMLAWLMRHFPDLTEWILHKAKKRVLAAQE